MAIGKTLAPKTRAAKPAELSAENALAIDGAGTLWAAGNRSLFAWDGKQVTAFNFKESFAIKSIAAAGDRVFFATNWGLLVKSGSDWRLYSKNDSKLHDSHLISLAVDRKGHACVIAYDDEVDVDHPIARFDGTDFAIAKAGADFPSGHETSCVSFDADNRVVLATKTGLAFADGKTWSAPGLGILKAVKLVAADGADVWACTAKGAHRIDRQGKETKLVSTPSRPTSIAIAGDTLWLGLSSGALMRVRGDEQKTFDGFTKSGLEHLAIGPDGTLWAATDEALFACRGDVVEPFGGAPVKAAPAKEAAPPPPPPPKKKRKLKALPKAPLIARKKLPAYVASAIESSRLKDALFLLVRPAIGIMLEKAGATGGSKLGGQPDLAATWPTYRGQRTRHLPFLLQVNLADVGKHDLEGLLPKKGRLVFFCDTQPDEIDDSAVIHETAKARPQATPKDLVARKSDDDYVALLPERGLSFYPTWTIPSVEYLEQHVELSDEDRTALGKVRDALASKDPKKSSGTRLLGWPDTLQGEIVTSPDAIVLLQIDGEMGGPTKLEELFSYWGNGIAHVVIAKKDLVAAQLAKASAELAYT